MKPAEDLAREIVSKVKFEINEIGRMGGHGGSNTLATHHFYDCVERYTKEAFHQDRLAVRKKCAEVAKGFCPHPEDFSANFCTEWRIAKAIEEMDWK